VVREEESDCERPVEPRKHRCNGVGRGGAALYFACDKMRNNFAVGLRLEPAPVGDQFVAQNLEVLDNAIVDQRHLAGDMRMGIIDGRGAVGCPAGMRDTYFATEW
jgi:hypothetical protein